MFSVRDNFDEISDYTVCEFKNHIANELDRQVAEGDSGPRHPESVLIIRKPVRIVPDTPFECQFSENIEKLIEKELKEVVYNHRHKYERRSSFPDDADIIDYYFTNHDFQTLLHEDFEEEEIAELREEARYNIVSNCKKEQYRDYLRKHVSKLDYDNSDDVDDDSYFDDPTSPTIQPSTCVNFNIETHGYAYNYKLSTLIIENLSFHESIRKIKGCFNCMPLVSIIFKHWNLNNIEKLQFFGNCEWYSYVEISDFTFIKCSMKFLLSRCSTSMLVVRDLHFLEPTSFASMFESCNADSYDINFSLEMATDLSRMFAYSTIEQFELHDANLSLVTSMSEMFKSCGHLIHVKFVDCDLSSCTDFTSMFEYCLKLKSVQFINCKFNTKPEQSAITKLCSSLELFEMIDAPVD